MYRRADEIYKTVSKELAATYTRALDEIRSTLSRLYEQYGVTGEFTRAQATQFLRNSRLEENIIRIAGSAVDANTSLITESMKASFDESFFRTAWAVDQAAGVSLGWGQVSDNAVRAAVGLGGDMAELEGVLSARDVENIGA